MKINMWLSVRKGTVNYGGTLWNKEVETDNIPLPGADEVILWSTDGDPAEGPQWKVKRRCMHADGSWHLELYTMIVDSSSLPLGPVDYQTWHTEVDGDPDPLLKEGGWVKYGQ